MQPPARCSNHRCVYIDQCVPCKSPFWFPGLFSSYTWHVSPEMSLSLLSVVCSHVLCKQFGLNKECQGLTWTQLLITSSVKNRQQQFLIYLGYEELPLLKFMAGTFHQLNFLVGGTKWYVRTVNIRISLCIC